MLHFDARPSDGIHCVQNWEVADATAKTAVVVTADDIGKVLLQLDTKMFYLLQDSTPTWVPMIVPNTGSLTEGSNLYFTVARVLATVLTGLSTAAGTTVTAAHTILQAIGFLQKQATDNAANITSNTSSISTLNGYSRKEFLPIACGDETTAITTGVKVTFVSPPYAMTLNQVTAHLTTAQTSGTIFTAELKLAGSTVFSTKPTIDNTETDTSTAATPSVLSTTAIPANSTMTAEVNQIGDGTAKGLKLNLIWTKT